MRKGLGTKGLLSIPALVDHYSLSHDNSRIQNLKDAFKNWPLVGGKIIVIRNGIKSTTGYGRDGARQALAGMFPQLKAALANAVAAHKNVFWVGTIAELHPVKNIDKARGSDTFIGERQAVSRSSPLFHIHCPGRRPRTGTFGRNNRLARLI